MVLCDTSLWIRYFRKSKDPQIENFIKLLLDSNVCINEYIYTEILQGIRDEKQFISVKQLLISLPMFELQGRSSINHAIQIYRTCNAKTKRINKTIDTFIAVTAIENNLELFHIDREFDVIAEYFPLKIYKS